MLPGVNTTKMNVIQVKENQKLVALTGVEISDLQNAVYSTMQGLDEELKKTEAEDKHKRERLAANADRLEKLYEGFRKLHY